MHSARSDEIEQVRELAGRAEGWLYDAEGILLYELARGCRGAGAIVEIGSWHGRSTIWLARGSRAGPGVKVYAVDPHTGSSEHRAAYGEVSTLESFRRNVARAGVEDLVVPLVATSEEAAASFTEPVELVFVDGAHEYELVRRDFDVWFPKVVTGGVMAFHDTTFKGWGPTVVVEECLVRSRWFRALGFADTILYGTKVERNSLPDRLRNRYVYALRNLFVFARERRVPRPVRRAGKALLRALAPGREVRPGSR